MTFHQYTLFPSRSVSVVVEKEIDERKREGDPSANDEKRLLEKLEKEAWQWAEQAVLLMTEVMKKCEEKREEEEKEMEV